jgi:hypothetical protein
MTGCPNIPNLYYNLKWMIENANVTGVFYEGGGRTYSTVTWQLMPDEVEMVTFASQKGKITLSLRNFNDTKISRDIEKRSVDFQQLEREIPGYNQRREMRRNRGVR